jgi:hypothetical protein
MDRAYIQVAYTGLVMAGSVESGSILIQHLLNMESPLIATDYFGAGTGESLFHTHHPWLLSGEPAAGRRRLMPASSRRSPCSQLPTSARRAIVLPRSKSSQSDKIKASALFLFAQKDLELFSGRVLPVSHRKNPTVLCKIQR